VIASFLYKQYEAKKETLNSLNEKIDKLKDEVGKAAVEHFKATGKKTMTQGVGVRVYTHYKYDKEKAVDYCREHLPAVLKLNDKLFKKYLDGVQQVQPLEFVQIEEEPRPAISSDLSKYIEQE
jgi:hypothetical protein